MLAVYASDGTKFVRQTEVSAAGPNPIWFDLHNPTHEEDLQVEACLGVSVPTREDMREIEASNRFYNENGATYITTFLVHNGHQGPPESTTITFILRRNHVVTVRYTEPTLFPDFRSRVERGDAPIGTGPAILIGLFESLIHKKADLIERVQDEISNLGTGIFDMKPRRDRNKRLDALLKAIGRQGDIVSRVQESSTSIDRSLHFFQGVARDHGCEEKTLQRISTAEHDSASLADNLRALSQRITFLLDATLGMITTEQNQIIKLFSVMGVMLMPPTVVASIYGMNFKNMPELDWQLGYPLAIVLMFISAAIPFFYFKSKGWL